MAKTLSVLSLSSSLGTTETCKKNLRETDGQNLFGSYSLISGSKRSFFVVAGENRHLRVLVVAKVDLIVNTVLPRTEHGAAHRTGA